MTVSLVQNHSGTGSSSNARATLSSGATAGNLLVSTLQIQKGIAGVSAPPSGWTQLIYSEYDSSTDVVVLAYLLSAAGGETLIQWTTSGVGSPNWSVEVFEFTESLGGTWSVDGSDGQDMGASTVTSAQCPSGITPTGNYDVFVVGSGTSGFNGASEAIDSGFTALDTATFGRLITGYKIKSDSTLENPTISWATAQLSGIVLAAFKNSASFVGSPPFSPRPIRRPLMKPR